MKGGLAVLVPIEEARTLILGAVRGSGSEPVPLDRAWGRILREPLVAADHQPPFDRSAMDGFAVPALPPAGPWRCVRTITAGEIAGAPLEAGTCAAVNTGAALPAATARVVPVEWTCREGDIITTDRPLGPDYIRRCGADCRKGDLLIRSGTRLDSPEIAVLAQHGAVHPQVAALPRIVHLVAGDELVEACDEPGDGRMRDTNSPMVRALVRETLGGAGTLVSLRSGDDPEAQVEMLQQSGITHTPVLILSGGAWKSDRDNGAALLERLGYAWLFRGVDLRPGKPFSAAGRDGRLAFLVPGNPVAHWVTWHLFIRPALQAMMGAGTDPVLMEVPLGRDWNPGPETRVLRWPCRLRFTPEGPRADPLELASSGDLSGLAGANALLHHVPVDRPLSAGRPVTVQILRCP